MTTWKGAAEVTPTTGFNHDLIDGATAVRFTQRSVALIEGGYGLECAPLTDEWRPG
ncbi:MAG: hypothetical protein U0X20_18540 [Caldilineaceae bacterium]